MSWNEIIAYQSSAPLLFNSGTFLVMFILFYASFYLLKSKVLLRTAYMTAFSLFFYYKSSGVFFLLLVASTLVNYFIGNKISASKSQSERTSWLVLSVVYNLGVLGYFKYTNFLLDTFNGIFGSGFEFYEIFLPVGISFYTFQTMSYTIDVYRNKMKPASSLLDFGFFVCYFPQLIAGPIVRAAEFIPQIRKKLRLTTEEFSKAWWLIMAGLIKKAVISDYISINYVDRVFDNPLLYSAFENLMAVYGYAIQIYCDFSGYSDMAIGLALLMGFRLPLNFMSPYKAVSITDFWRRWHISLSSWLKDYLYISLGGNRRGSMRTYVNLLITMLLGGLWHGANWKFVIWGALHGAMLAFEKLIFSITGKDRLTPFPVLSGIITFHFVCFCWIFFRAADYDIAFSILSQIGGSWPSLGELWNILLVYKNVVVLAGLGFLVHWLPDSIKSSIQNMFYSAPLIVKAALVTIACWWAWQAASSEVQPFIYFQF